MLEVRTATWTRLRTPTTPGTESIETTETTLGTGTTGTSALASEEVPEDALERLRVDIGPSSGTTAR